MSSFSLRNLKLSLTPYRSFQPFKNSKVCLSLLTLVHLLMFTFLTIAAFKARSVEAAEPDCSSRLRTSAAVSFDTQKIGQQNLLFQSVYTEYNWAGDLMALCLDSRGDPSTCQCEDQSGSMEQCTEPFLVGFPEIKWSADTIAWEIDRALNKNPDDGWWLQRQVITYNDHSHKGIPFDYLSISDNQRHWLRHDPDLVTFIRGDRSFEGDRFRMRSSYYGDFRNSPPESYASIVVAGANDGMLHVFDEQTGHEYFSYVPNLIFSTWHEESAVEGNHKEKLALLSEFDYQDDHQFYVDGPVSIRYLEDRSTTLAVGSLGKGGKGIYALNIFGIREMGNIESQAENIVMWEFPDPRKDGLQETEGVFIPVGPGVDESSDIYSDSITSLSTDPHIGKVLSKPQIVKLPYPNPDGFRWCVVFGNGYHSFYQTPVLYVLDAYDGSLIKRVLTTKPEYANQSDFGSGCNIEFGCNGLSAPVLVDDDENSIVDYGYAGDLAGNLWKFDFTTGAIYGADGYIAAFHDPSDLDIDGRPTPRPLIAVKDKQGTPQPITTQPTVTRGCTGTGDGMMVLFGTGWLDPGSDPGSDTQSIYGIWDWQSFWRKNPRLGVDPMVAYYGELGEQSTGGVRTLSNLDNLMVSTEADRVGLLEQSQQSFVGLNYASQDDPRVIAGLAYSGEVEVIVDDPQDFTAFDQVVRTLSSRPINWLNPQDLSGGITEPAHMGWYFDLPFADEQLASDPVVYDGVLYYSTSLWTDGECGIDTSNQMIMAHDSCSGGGADTIVFDLNGDGLMSSSDTVALYDLDGTLQGDSEQAAGIISTNSVGGPQMIAAKDNDLLYAARYISDQSGGPAENIIEPGLQPEITKRAVRGRNLGMTFWRELY